MTCCLLWAKKARLACACSASWLLRVLHAVMLPPHGQNAGQGYHSCFSDPATNITPAHMLGFRSLQYAGPACKQSVTNPAVTWSRVHPEALKAQHYLKALQLTEG